MSAFKAQVKNGRLVVDEPTDLPEGEVIGLVPLDEVLLAAATISIRMNGNDCTTPSAKASSR